MSFTNILLFSIAALTTIFYYYFIWCEQRNRREYARRNVAYVPQRNAFLQVITRQRAELHKHEDIKQKGKVFGFNYLGEYTILIAEPELVQLVLSKDFTNFTDRRKFETNDPIFSNIVGFASGERWKRLRAIVTPTFSTGKVRRMKPMMDETMRTMLKNMNNTIAKSDHVNMKDIYGAYTMDTIIQVGFGIKVDSLLEQDNPLIVHGKRMLSLDMTLENVVTLTMIFLCPKVANALNLRINGSVTDFFTEFSMKIIEQKRNDIKQNLGKANNFIELLLEAELEEEMTNRQVNGEESANSVDKQQNGMAGENGFSTKRKYMTNQEIVAHCIMLFIAGYETTASTLTMTSYHLAMNPDVQEKLYQEIKNVTEKLSKEAGPNGPNDPVELITIDSLSRFEYLNAVVNESLRLNPPITYTERLASSDMVLASVDGRLKINVKKDDVIHIPKYSMHRDPEQFPEPEKFKPERFLGSPTFHKYAYLPFGLGPRGCLGKSYGHMQTMFAVLHTVLHYKLSVCQQTKIPLEYYYHIQLTLPRNTILKVEKR